MEPPVFSYLPQCIKQEGKTADWILNLIDKDFKILYCTGLQEHALVSNCSSRAKSNLFSQDMEFKREICIWSNVELLWAHFPGILLHLLANEFCNTAPKWGKWLWMDFSLLVSHLILTGWEKLNDGTWEFRVIQRWEMPCTCAWRCWIWHLSQEKAQSEPLWSSSKQDTHYLCFNFFLSSWINNSNLVANIKTHFNLSRYQSHIENKPI